MSRALNPKPFLGQVISITGAGSGIGQETALTLYARGATLALADINPENLAETEKLLEEYKAEPGQQIMTTVVDVSNASQVSTWIDDVVSRFGRLDHAGNICGVTHLVKVLKDMTDKDFDFVVNVNLRGTFNCLQAQVKHLKRGASIVNFTSGAGLKPEIGMTLYASTKAGLQALTVAAARDHGPDGIRVNAVSPGATITAGLIKLGMENFTKPMAEATPLGRVAETQDVARAVSYLMSEEASFVNGVILRVDGGYLSTSH